MTATVQHVRWPGLGVCGGCGAPWLTCDGMTLSELSPNTNDAPFPDDPEWALGHRFKRDAVGACMVCGLMRGGCTGVRR